MRMSFLHWKMDQHGRLSCELFDCVAFYKYLYIICAGELEDTLQRLIKRQRGWLRR